MELDTTRINAIISELTGQRNAALDRCASMAADIAVLKARLVALEPKPEPAKQTP
jgi:hypothetical protein